MRVLNLRVHSLGFMGSTDPKLNPKALQPQKLWAKYWEGRGFCFALR